MKLKATVRDFRVLVLTESGSTHNFISDKLVEELKLPKREVVRFGVIAKPTKCFESLKTALTTMSVLSLPNFTEQFTVECDVSVEGVGAILLQDGHPIAYFSKGFSFSNRFKSTYDRELLALVLGSPNVVKLVRKAIEEIGQDDGFINGGAIEYYDNTSDEEELIYELANRGSY